MLFFLNFLDVDLQLFMLFLSWFLLKFYKFLFKLFFTGTLIVF